MDGSRAGRHNDVVVDLSPADRELLLDLSEVAVRAHLRGTHYPGPDVNRLPPSLLIPCNAFVVVRVRSSVFGCSGETGGPIGACVPELALSAAFDAVRGRRLDEADLAYVYLTVSVVEHRHPIDASTRTRVLQQLDGEIHGLSITASDHHAALLPSAWAERPDPEEYLDTVMRRAGLDPSTWPDDISAELFTTVDFGRLLS